ncbi:MAG: LysE family translocator [Candidatus Thiodiazotropha sp.]|jgi:threonine/homoserine/homoserine lactone efflux protein
MIPMELLLPYIAASTLLCLAPGPDNLFVLTHSARYGYRGGWQVILGLCTGLLVHTSLVAWGLAALLYAYPIALHLIQWAGALYLLVLAWQALFGDHSESPNQALETRGIMLYRRGIIMNLSNPKISLFFLAFLPQFVANSSLPVAWQLMFLGGVFILITLLTFGSIAYLAGILGQWLNRSPGIRLWLDRISGLVFVAIALNLLLGSIGG